MINDLWSMINDLMINDGNDASKCILSIHSRQCSTFYDLGCNDSAQCSKFND